MNFVFSPIESLVISLLEKGPLYSLEIISEIAGLRKGTPKQSTYLALRRLIAREVLVYNKKFYSLNELWLRQLRMWSSTASKTLDSKPLLDLAEGESVNYVFDSFYKADALWCHLFQLFQRHENYEKKPIVKYNPHQVFFTISKESERALYESAQKTKQMICMLIGGKTPLDLSLIAKEFDGDITKGSVCDSNLFPRNYYVNVVGNMIIEVFFDNTLSKNIDEWYLNNKKETSKAISELKDLLAAKNKFRMKVSRNSKKAEVLRKKVGKYFFIKK